HLLLGKSMAEALLITAIAVGFYFATTNPYLRGVLDEANSQTVSGWAVNESNPSSHVEVQLFIDDKFVANAQADQYRPDVRRAKRAGDDWHGFVFQTPVLSSGSHVARVYGLHSTGDGERRTLQLIGKPYSFQVEAK